MLKVCMIVHQCYRRDGRVRRYAEALADVGAQVDVLSLKDEKQPDNEKWGGIRVHSIPIRRGYGKRASYLIEYAVAAIAFTIRLLTLYAKNRYQVIHVHNMPEFLIFTAIIPKILGAKLILDIHDPMPEFYMSKYNQRNPGLGFLLMRMQEKLSSLVAHGIITANSNFKQSLIKRGIPSDKIKVIRNIPDSRIFNRGSYAKKDNSKGDSFTLIYHGTIAPRYGLDVVIRSLPLLMPKIPQLRFVVVGQSVEYVDELVRLAKKLDVSSAVQFKPPVPIEEVPMEIMQADVGIYPAISDPHMNIAMPSKVLEYAVMGIPIIASRLKVLEDLFTDSAVLFFEPGADSEFANCVVELYNNKKRRDELVRNVDCIFTLKSSWKSERTKYFNVLNNLLSSKK